MVSLVQIICTYQPHVWFPIKQSLKYFGCDDRYEFGVYSQLDPYLSKLFFPASDPQMQQLSFYASYAVGFIARPFGGLIFGHLGDVRSRGLSLMISIIAMATPTGKGFISRTL